MYSLAHLHTFGFQSSAQALLILEDVTRLPAQLQQLKGNNFYILGEGSNTLFLDDYFGTIVRPAFTGIELTSTKNDNILKVGASENWHHLVLWCLQHEIYGLENLALIPGTVGAAPIQNIGAYGVEIASFIHHIEYYDIKQQVLKSIDSKHCQFGYRDSIFKQELAGQVIITNVTFAVPKQWQAVLQYGELRDLKNPNAYDIFDKVVELRQSKLPDPKEIGNAGSFFKNPIISIQAFTRLQQNWPSIPSYVVDSERVKVPAAWLIDQLGFKGQKVGGIACHPQQALVLTNDGTGTGEQLLQLARAITTAVLEEFSIVLENEVRLMGKQGSIML